jgi:hypothetical protein
MEIRSSTGDNCANVKGRIHEYGEYEVAGRGQEKVLKPSLK